MKASVQSSLEHGLKILKEDSDLMKGIGSKPYFSTGRRFPQGPDLAFTKPSREAFKMLHSSFQKAKSFLSENALHHIAGDICFPSCTTVHVEHSFGEIRTPSHLSPDMHADYASRRPSCNSFRCILNQRATTLDEQFTKRRLHKDQTGHF